jgi:hypothetical protein
MKNLLLLLLIVFFINSCTNITLGKLTDADTYFSVPIESDSHQFASFISLQSNNPAGLLDQKGEFYYLNIEPNLLSKYIYDQFKIKGKKDTITNIITPEKVWVKKEKSWILIYSNKRKL